MFRFLHAADIHLDSPLRGLDQYEGAPVEQIRGATRRALENLVATAKDRKVDFVLIAGDLYDGNWKDYRTGQFFSQQMGRLREANIPVFLITGNHDAESLITRQLTLPDNVVRLSSSQAETATTSLLNDLPVAIHGRGFDRREVTENVVPTYPAAEPGKFNIGMLHTSLTGGSGHDPYAPCKADDLLGCHYQYWALGHIHQRNSHQQDPAWNVPIVFPGNIQGRHIRETGAKGCVLVSVDDALSPSLEFVPLDVFRWEHLQIDVSNAKTFDDAVEVVAQALAPVVAGHAPRGVGCRVTLSGRTPISQQLVGERERLIEEIRNLPNRHGWSDLWIEKVDIGTLPAVPWEELVDDDGPLAELHQVLTAWRQNPSQLLDEHAALAKLAGELKAHRDLDAELAEWGQGPRVKALIDDVENLLLDRLLAAREEPGA